MICPGIQDGPFAVALLMALAVGAALSFVFLGRASANPLAAPDFSPHDFAAHAAPQNNTPAEPEWLTFVPGRGLVYGRADEGLEKPPAA